MLSGATIPSDSIVDLDDLWSRGINPPSDADSNGALLCMTDLQDCCDTPNVHGDWYFPDDNRVECSTTEFRVNRGASVIRLWRRYSLIPEIGRFRCEVPNNANPSVNQILYVNICKFITLIMCNTNILIVAENFLLDESFAKSSYLYTTEIFSGIIFCLCSNGNHADLLCNHYDRTKKLQCKNFSYIV